MNKRVMLIVLDSVGIGELPDAQAYGDVGSNTLRANYKTGKLNVPNLEKLGLFNIEGIDYAPSAKNPSASFARMAEASKGKDTTIGHWEISGLVSKNPLPTYPNGFPKELLDSFSEKTGRKVLCNLPYSGTKVLEDYGDQHMATGDLIVYTSADSVFQIAAHEEIVPLEELYNYCKIARELLVGEHALGRVIARPFVGNSSQGFTRTSNRKDFSLEPQGKTICDIILEKNIPTVGVGKIYDIFAGKGIEKSIKSKSNFDGMQKTIDMVKEGQDGFIFVNLVDFDMKFGHRNDVEGYAAALNEFDAQLGELMSLLKEDDIVIITADHGCDPTTEGSDHSREYVPMLIFGENIKSGVDLGTRASFSDIAATLADIFKVENPAFGESFFSSVSK
ncbi:MAG: phosphopentomutase [Proteocatella sp.]